LPLDGEAEEAGGDSKRLVAILDTTIESGAVDIKRDIIIESKGAQIPSDHSIRVSQIACDNGEDAPFFGVCHNSTFVLLGENLHIIAYKSSKMSEYEIFIG